MGNFKMMGLFSGMGGFEYAAQLMGWEVVAWCEYNGFCQRILKYHFPDANSHGDITQQDFTQYANAIDILCGGFPCQPFSVAGKQLGTDDDRYLWPQMLRAIREIKPRYVVGENVGGLLSWSGGMVFEQVCTDLEAEGYEVQAFVLPACAVNAPHRRDRVWIVAHAISHGGQELSGGLGFEAGKNKEQIGQRVFNADKPIGKTWPTPNPHNTGAAAGFGEVQRADGEIPQRNDNAQFGNAGDAIAANPDSINGRPGNKPAGRKQKGQKVGNGGKPVAADTQGERLQTFSTRDKEFSAQVGPGIYGGSCNEQFNHWQNFPTQSPVCTGDDGLPSGLDGITLSQWRNKTIEAGGNAIVPWVALEIFKAIEQAEAVANA